jgi:Fe-S cluster assembly iron-binding protein IscA
MLQMTSAAAAVVKSARERQDISEHYGLRVALKRSGRDAGIHLRFANDPLDGDQVIEIDGLRVFVADELAEALDRQLIDARSDTNGNGSGLVLRQQS